MRTLPTIAALALVATCGPSQAQQRAGTPSTAEVLRLICAPANIRGDECRDARGYPKDGRRGRCNVKIVDTPVSGRFLSADRTTVLVSYTSDCEPHVNNFGGSLALELDAGRLIFRNYVRGTLTGRCLTPPAAGGTQRLICLGGFMGQGHVESTVLDIRLSQSRTGAVEAKTEILAIATSSEGAYGAEKVDCSDTMALIGFSDPATGPRPNTIALKVEYADDALIKQACAPGAKPPEGVLSEAEPGSGFLQGTKTGTFVLDLATKQLQPDAQSR